MPGATGGARRAGKDVYKTIHIKEKCWIGAEVLILPGVTIGKGCVVAAGAIVTTDVEENTMVAGIPARIIKRLPVLLSGNLNGENLLKITVLLFVLMIL